MSYKLLLAQPPHITNKVWISVTTFIHMYCMMYFL